MLPRPSKASAKRYIQNLLPEYGCMLEKMNKDGGWIRFEPWLYKILDNLKIADYAKHYTNESLLPKLFVAALFDIDQYNKLTAELMEASDEERTEFLDEWIRDVEQGDFDEEWSFKIPKTPEEEEEARQLFESLSEEERIDACKRGACFWVFYMINFYNYIALMVHGRKMSQLVTEAIQGNDESFVLAVQIDPSVMWSIPYFQQREIRAYREGNITFLEKLAYRRICPPFRGKIRFPLLYLLFSMLDSMNLLDDLLHKEILEICDAAGLDRWQNRIQDVNALTKRLREYRRFQRHKFIQESMP